MGYFMKTTEKVGKELIIQINNELIAARHSYYADANPIMADVEYDSLEKQLRGMVTAMPEFVTLATVLTSVGSDLTNESGRMKHISPMLSLENLYSFDDVKLWCAQFPEGTAFVVEPKIDGASLSCHYINRQLVKAVTRGDGQYGEDVTKVMLASGAIPATLPQEFYPESLVEVRGEVFMSQAQFEKINASSEKKFASPRNLAAGTMKLQDLELVKSRGLQFYPWQVEGISDEFLTKKNLSGDFAHHSIEYFCLTSGTFPKPFDATFYTADTLITAIDGYLKTYRDTVLHKGCGIGTDGYVIKLASVKLRKEAGLKTTTPRWAFAWKYPSQLVETTLEAVTWYVGRSGGLTPVASVTPVNVSGATVSKINLNNFSWITQKGVKIGDKVAISRGGEVIPYLNEVVATYQTSIPILEPTSCPACGENITVEADVKSGILTHSCTNDKCPGRLSAYLEYVAGRDMLEIDELGPETITQLIKDGYITSLPDLFDFSNRTLEGIQAKGEEIILNRLTRMGYSGVLLIKMCKSLEKVKTRDWDRWLAALGIPGIAKSLSKLLSTHFRLGEKDMDILPSILSKGDYSLIEGIGDKKEAEIRKALPRITETCKALYEYGVRPKSILAPQADPSKLLPLAGYAICITGEFPTERDPLSKMLTSLGAQMKSGVSKKLTHLLVGEGAGQSKLAKARELNIPLLHQDWLEKILTANGMVMEKTEGKFETEWDDL